MCCRVIKVLKNIASLALGAGFEGSKEASAPPSHVSRHLNLPQPSCPDDPSVSSPFMTAVSSASSTTVTLT